MRRLGALALAGAACLFGQTPEFHYVAFPGAPEATMLGAALAGRHLFTWGDLVLIWELPEGRARRLVESRAGFGPGGCVADVNRDGRPDLVLLERPAGGNGLGRLVWLEAPSWRNHLIDSGADFRDCLPATLDGRRGLLVIHRYAQLRFYLAPEAPGGPWPYRELYSIYTPSRQGGLLLADIDGDGREDIVAGNYWLRSPERFDLSWRLFAINLWMETPDSSMSLMAWARILEEASPQLVICQTDTEEARLAWFSQPAPPTELWPEHRLEGDLRLRRPGALAAGDLDGDGRDEIVVGERAGAGSRLIVFWNRGGGAFRPETLAQTGGLAGLWLVDLDGDGDRDILAVGAANAGWWRNQRRK
jgi:hypothetical protein